MVRTPVPEFLIALLKRDKLILKSYFEVHACSVFEYR